MEVACDVLVCSDDEDAKSDVIKLAEAAGMRGIDAGPLAIRRGRGFIGAVVYQQAV